KGLGPFERESAVKEREGLRCRRRHVTARTTLVSIRHVKGLEHGIPSVTAHEDINAATVAFCQIFGYFPPTPAFHPGRELGKDTGATHFEIEQTGNREC